MPGVRVYALPSISLCRHTALTQKGRYQNSGSIHEGDESFMPPWGSCPGRRQRKAAAAEARIALPLCGTSSTEGGDLGHSLTWLKQLWVGRALLLPQLREFPTAEAAPRGWHRGAPLGTEAFCTHAALGMSLLRVPGGMVGPSAPCLCS